MEAAIITAVGGIVIALLNHFLSKGDGSGVRLLFITVAVLLFVYEFANLAPLGVAGIGQEFYVNILSAVALLVGKIYIPRPISAARVFGLLGGIGLSMFHGYSLVLILEIGFSLMMRHRPIMVICDIVFFALGILTTIVSINLRHLDVTPNASK